MSNFRGGEINWRDRIIYNNYCVLFVNLWFVKIDTVQTKSSSLHTNRACDNGKQYMSVFSSYNNCNRNRLGFDAKMYHIFWDSVQPTVVWRRLPWL